MQRNEGTLDRGARAVAAVVLAVVAVIVGLDAVGGIIAGVAALVMGVTAATGFCPLYRIFRVDTCPRRTA